jgi:tetratricopeptide (TPR) repeat protein
MARKTNRSLLKLPQQPETWGITLQLMHIWITPPDEPPSRPWVLLVYNFDQGVLQRLDLFETDPTPADIMEALTVAMRQPEPMLDQQPHRPEAIAFESPDLAADLQSDLEALDIQIRTDMPPGTLDVVLAEMEEHMRGGPEIPSLLSVRGVTPNLVGGVFAAAATFYRAAPWIQLADQQTLAVRVSPEKRTRYAQVLGNGGVTYGLAMYRSWKDVERLFGFVDHPLETLPKNGGHSFTFDAIHHFPFTDLTNLEQYNWEIAADDAYPVPLIFKPNQEVKRPSATDMRWYEAAMLAIPLFVQNQLQADGQGDYQPVETTLTVTTHEGEKEVLIKYPGGTLPKETRPAQLMDWPMLEEDVEDDVTMEIPRFDPRLMEGVMSQIGGSGIADSALERAQSMMYEAWEADNPARRIILAHEALEVSPLCADAYILLAEEEADTLGRALEYYQQAVAAGEQALGKDYFEEYVGHFWGLLETRPYMRARQSLAECLWELGRETEAAGHFQAMLHLNPGDNQGVRYSLLALLLSTQQDDQAHTLLNQYQDDAMAVWLYSRALLNFRAKGASRGANKALREALTTNPHVPAYLTGRKRIPNYLPELIGWGDENEAVSYAANHLPFWRRTPGAIDWLTDQAKPASRKRGRK